MKSTKSGLFQVKNSKVDPLIQDKIEALRKEARSYQEINNALVEKKWDIDIQIVRSKSLGEKKVLREQQTEILAHIEAGDYVTRISHLIETIKDLEIEHYGYSDLQGSSPCKI